MWRLNDGKKKKKKENKKVYFLFICLDEEKLREKKWNLYKNLRKINYNQIK